MFAVRLLGQLQVEVSGEPSAVSAPLQRGVLASLALARHALTMDQLVDALWDDPPANAVNAVQQYVSALRRRLGRDRVVTAGSGYRLDVATDSVDVDRFQELTAEARRRQRAGDLAGAARLLGEAVGLWRGTALADAPDCPCWLPRLGSFSRRPCSRWRSSSLRSRTTADTPPRSSPAEALAAQHPLDEAVAAQLMGVLAGAGRTADALKVYERMRARLADELGGASSRASCSVVRSPRPGRRCGWRVGNDRATIESKDNRLVRKQGFYYRLVVDGFCVCCSVFVPADRFLGRGEAPEWLATEHWRWAACVLVEADTVDQLTTRRHLPRRQDVVAIAHDHDDATIEARTVAIGAELVLTLPDGSCPGR